MLQTVEKFVTKDVIALVDTYPHDGDMAKKQNSILFHLSREIEIGEGIQAELRLGLMQILVVLDQTTGSEIYWMFISSNMAIYAIEMTKLEVSGYLVALKQRSFQLFSEKN